MVELLDLPRLTPGDPLPGDPLPAVSTRRLLEVLRSAGPDLGWLAATARRGPAHPRIPAPPPGRVGPRWRRRTPEHLLRDEDRGRWQRLRRHRGPIPAAGVAGRWRAEGFGRSAARLRPGGAR